MLAKRIIPCLDVKDGRTVKGVNFVNLKDAGDIVELAARYSSEGADELVFLDITASSDNRSTRLAWVEQVAAAISIPFTVGGGISSEADVEALLKKGADKISINSSALADPGLIDRLAYGFGSQCVVVAIDARQEAGGWQVYSKGGRVRTEKELFSWAEEAAARGAGEILFTSMDNDGTHKGFANEATSEISRRLTIPVIASGGAGTPEDFYRAFTLGKADAALAAGVFHYGQLTIPEVKEYLAAQGIEVRL
ncbi:MAG: imidazole glycerol phosphate synthase subunit HisF [Odoribacter splanchnicus]|nr:imidazole glycerol phosphate synthase subunit HisF [Odoribacter splanchnicus]